MELVRAAEKNTKDYYPSLLIPVGDQEVKRETEASGHESRSSHMKRLDLIPI